MLDARQRPLAARPGRAAPRPAAHARPAPLLRRHERRRGRRGAAQARRNDQAHAARRPARLARLAGGRTDDDSPTPPPDRAAAAAPGRFDAVLNRARARRYHRLSAVAGVAAVFLAGIVGGLAMGGQVSGVPNSHRTASPPVARRRPGVHPRPPPSDDQPPARPQVRRKQQAREVDSSSPASHRRRSRGAHQRPLLVRGRVVDRDGDPVGGLYVYTGTVCGRGLRAHVADPGGDHRRPRPVRRPVHRRPGAADLVAAQRAAGRCPPTGTGQRRGAPSRTARRSKPRTVTEITPGASIYGHVTHRGRLRGRRLPDVAVARRPPHHRGPAEPACSDGDGFRVSGLPEGTHVLSARRRADPGHRRERPDR